MKMYVASVGVYCYEKDRVVVECFKTTSSEWKQALILHSEFAEELQDGKHLEWLSHDFDEARRELDNADLQVDIVFTEIADD